MFGFRRARLAIYGVAALLVWHASGHAPPVLSATIDRANNAILGFLPGQADTLHTSPLGTWRTCKPINVYINAHTQAEHELTVQAVHTAAGATGAPLVVANTTGATPTTDWMATQAPKRSITIAWTAPDATDFLTPTRVGGAQVTTNARGNITAAGITINREKTPQYALAFGEGRTMGNALLHEIGHALGAPHTHAGTLMYKNIDASAPNGYTDEDQQTLRNTVPEC